MLDFEILSNGLGIDLGFEVSRVSLSMGILRKLDLSNDEAHVIVVVVVADHLYFLLVGLLHHISED